MKLTLLGFAAVCALGVYTQGVARAQSFSRNDRPLVVERIDSRAYNEGGAQRERFERERRHHRTKTVYIIEDGRPVRRVVYVDGRGRYYREERGQQIFIQERVFESYPNRYFLRDGRRREGITFDIR